MRDDGTIELTTNQGYEKEATAKPEKPIRLLDKTAYAQEQRRDKGVLQADVDLSKHWD